MHHRLSEGQQKDKTKLPALKELVSKINKTWYE